jgi:AraC-like DNA-binding protein/predicted transcriptional regulator YdeE
MAHFKEIKKALIYIDNHLDEPLDVKSISNHFNFSTFYFHRLFSAIVGKTLAAYIRDRRLQSACVLLAAGNKSMLEIGLDCGFDSAQSFARTFKQAHGLTPSEYRKTGLQPVIVSVDELIIKFTNRIKGGIILNPKIIKKEALIIAGTKGDVRYIKTPEIWQNFEQLSKEKQLTNKISENGYEIRTNVITNGEEIEIVYTGSAVSSEDVDPAYVLYKIPASKYIVFDVIIRSPDDYGGTRDAMYDWLKTHHEYKERVFDGVSYLISTLDDRYTGEIDGSIYEEWIPVEKK